MMKYEGYVVGSILRNLRKEKKLTVEEMSGETGISTSSIKQYEQGGRQLSIRNLFVLIDFFNVDANTILNVDGECEEKSIDTKLRGLNANQRKYLQKSFEYMLDHVSEIVS